MDLVGLLEMKVVTTFYRRLVVFARPLSSDVELPELAVPVEIRSLSRSEVGAYHLFRPDQPAALIEELLARGRECTAVWHRGRIVHAAWAYLGRAYVAYLNRDMILREEEVLILDSFTLSQYRRMSLAKARSAYQAAEFAARGLRRSLGIVAAENRVGLAVVTAAGSRPIGMYACLRAGPFSRYWQRPDGDAVLPPLVARGATAAL